MNKNKKKLSQRFQEGKLNKFFKDTFVGKTVSGLVREGLQVVPGVGTIITNFKKNTPGNPEGAIKLRNWEYYRIVIGLGAAVLIAKGIMTQDQIDFVMGIMGFK